MRIIPGMCRIASADLPVGARGAGPALLRPVFPEDLEPVQPDIHKVIPVDIALHEFGPRFYIEACRDVAVGPDTRGMYSCTAKEEPVPDITLKIKT